ncbi:MAG TPA: homocysteine S-methyltransferase family protein [Candidatus Acidoferrum sp.]|nr:homocysteine S-methyltransferase family protein [Candidatus Acidoferrum sp.]
MEDYWPKPHLVDACAPTEQAVGEDSSARYFEAVVEGIVPIPTGDLADWMDTPCDAVVLPAFEANRQRLEGTGYEGRLAEYAAKLLSRSERADGEMVFGAAVRPCPDPEETEWHIDRRIAAYAEQAAAIEGAGFDFIQIFDMQDLTEGRAALLAAKEATDLPVIVSASCDEDGMVGETDVMACLAVCQGIGCAAFGLSCYNRPDVAAQQLARLYPYAAVPLFVKLDAYEQDGYDRTLMSPGRYAAHVRSCLEAGAKSIFTGAGAVAEYAQLAGIELAGFSQDQVTAGPKEDEVILSATSREAHFIDPMLDISEPLFVGPGLDEDIYDAEQSGVDAVKIHLREVDDIELFSESLYMLSLPLCLSADDLSLFERAAMLYPGRALYDGTCDFEDDELRPILEKYGVIEL